MHCPDCEKVARSRIKSDYECPISLHIRLLFDVLQFGKKRQRKGKLEKLEYLRNLIAIFLHFFNNLPHNVQIYIFDGSHNHVHLKYDRNKSKAR